MVQVLVMYEGSLGNGGLLAWTNEIDGILSSER